MKFLVCQSQEIKTKKKKPNKLRWARFYLDSGPLTDVKCEEMDCNCLQGRVQRFLSTGSKLKIGISGPDENTHMIFFNLSSAVQTFVLTDQELTH